MVATLALFLAIGGGAFALGRSGFVSPKGTIKLCVARDGSLTAVKPKSRCRRGSQTIVVNQKGIAGPQGPPGPSTGPAGGDLTGNYPNPTIGAAKVGTSKLADGSVTAAKLGAGAVLTGKLGEAAVTNPKLGPSSVGAGNIQAGAVRAAALGLVTTVENIYNGTGIIHEPTSTNTLHVDCPAGTRVISGGFDSGVIGAFSPSASFMSGNGWTLQGTNGANTVSDRVFAYCLNG